MAHDVFISHASKDKVVADAVCAALEAEKIRCWIAPRDIPLGEHWAASINNAIKTTSIMVLIFSENSNQSEQVINELTLAVKSKVTVIPFKIEDALPHGVMEYYLAATHWLDAMNPPTKKQIDTLVEKIKSGLGVKQAKVAATQVESQEVTVSIPEIKQRPKKETPAINKKTGLAVVAVLACALLLFGGYRLLNPVSENDAIEAVAEVGSDQQAVPTTAPQKDEAGNEIVVTSTADSGDGTLRWALQTARYGDTIIFDPKVFPPDKPATIFVMSPLPLLRRGGLIINASNAGVIIDGSKGESPDFFAGIHIESADNIIMGLQIVNCWGYDPKFDDYYAGAGIHIANPTTRNNIIGGDRSIGTGPSGQGNIIAGNAIGINIVQGASGNIITGNIIGADASGEQESSYDGNDRGISISINVAITNVYSEPSNNIIGPDNIIAFNRLAIEIGLPEHDEGSVYNIETVNNTITANKIFNNGDLMIIYGASNNGVSPPRIISVNLVAGTVRGSACPGCMVEIFSDRGYQGEIFEGRVQADENGNFSFEAGKRLTGPNITATATDENGNTSEFSAPYYR